MLEKIVKRSKIGVLVGLNAIRLYGCATPRVEYYKPNLVNERPSYCEGRINDPKCEETKTYPLFVVEFK